MEISKVRLATWVLLPVIALGWGCATIIDFDGPFGSTTSGAGGSGGNGGDGTGSATTSTTSTTSTGCTPTTSCAAEGATCGMISNGCEKIDCGTCAAPLTCADATHTCTCANVLTSQALLAADTKVSSAAGWDCGTISSGDATCMHLTVDPQLRGLLRFSLDGAVTGALATPGSLLSAKLTIIPADVCQSFASMPKGKLDTWVMRSDWNESEARWCHRSGATGTTTAPWGAAGVNDPVNDFGGLAGSVDMDPVNAPITIDLDPKAIEASAKFVVNNNISFRLVGEPGALLVMKTKEAGASSGATLVLQYCP